MFEGDTSSIHVQIILKVDKKFCLAKFEATFNLSYPRLVPANYKAGRNHPRTAMGYLPQHSLENLKKYAYKGVDK